MLKTDMVLNGMTKISLNFKLTLSKLDYLAGVHNIADFAIK